MAIQGATTRGGQRQKHPLLAVRSALVDGWRSSSCATGGEIYGNDGDLRRWLEGQQRAYVLAVARNHPIWQDGRQVRIEALIDQVPEDGWQQIAVGDGSKGPRISDWACARLPYLTDEGWSQWMLLRRSVSDPHDLAFYRAFGPEDTPVAELARVAGTR